MRIKKETLPLPIFKLDLMFYYYCFLFFYLYFLAKESFVCYLKTFQPKTRKRTLKKEKREVTTQNEIS